MINSQLVIPDIMKRYVSLVEADELHKALKKNGKKFNKFLKHMPENKINYSYAEGKWTIKQVLQHILDAERVFAYRALWFARKDLQPLPGFDENLWALQAFVSERDWNDLRDEFKVIRKSTELLFNSFSDEQLHTTGVSNNTVVSVATLGYICAGHAAHHMNVINERYFSDMGYKL